MKVDYDTRNMDNPNAFGELLRDWAFVKHGSMDYGCYSTFDMRDGFEKVDVSKYDAIKEFFLGFMPYGPQNSIHAYYHPENDILVMWHWEGDGALIIGEDYRFCYNGDCKKDHGWEWIDDDEYLKDYLDDFTRLMKDLKHVR